MPLRVLALIPARAGSRELRDKNIRTVAGVPMLVRAVRLAQASASRGEVWTIVVSTDSPRYAALARRAGAQVPFLRPRRLATARARLIDAVLHAVNELSLDGQSFDAVVLLSACAPLVRPGQVRAALRLFQRHREAVAAVVTDRVPASWRFTLLGGRLSGPPRRVGRRQTALRAVRLAGAFYVATPAWLKHHHQFVVPGRTRAVLLPRTQAVDVDDALDLAWARWLAGTRKDRSAWNV